jgi:predicted O-methyltransferase YrrM
MNDQNISLPSNYPGIKKASEEVRFSMSSDLQTGSLLRTLISSKPSGSFLELGTGTGLSLSWIVEAMDTSSSVISIDNNETFLEVARKHFNQDTRVKIVCTDGNEWIKNNQNKRFDLIFADAFPGKYESLEETLNLLKPGGLYFIDDMLPQPNWPSGHQTNVDKLLAYLDSRNDLRLTKMNWSTGLVIVTKMTG